MKNNLNKRGFTLIELMVVVAIMAVLASVGFVSYGSVKKKGNDAKIKSDIQNMVSAAEMIKSNGVSLDAGGTCGAPGVISAAADDVIGNLCNGSAIETSATDVHVSAIPVHPDGTNLYQGGVNEAGQNYCISGPLSTAPATYFKCINGSCTESTICVAGDI